MAVTMWSPEALVRHLVSSLVGQGAQIKVWTSGTQKKCVVHVCMNPGEVNKLVGEGGKVAQAIHTFLSIIGKKRNQLITLKMESLSNESFSSKKEP